MNIVRKLVVNVAMTPVMRTLTNRDANGEAKALRKRVHWRSRYGQRGGVGGRVVRCRRSGMTLVEVVIAMALLSGVLLALAAFAFRFAQSTGNARLIAVASQLVADRLETVKGAQRYATIDSLYQGVEPSVAGYPGFARQTIVQHVGGNPTDTVDYRIVTVEVRNARLPAPMRKTTIIAAF